MEGRSLDVAAWRAHIARHLDERDDMSIADKVNEWNKVLKGGSSRHTGAYPPQ